MRAISPAGLALLASLSLAPTLPAQIRASERSTVAQTVDGTVLTVSYSRPRARGRSTIFGTKAVQWDEVWTPGANYATTFEASRDVELNGRKVPKGKYSVWFVVKAQGDWTVVLDPRARLFHMEHPDSTAAQIRFPAKVRQEPNLETLTFWFPSYTVRSATLAFQWGTYRLDTEVTVAPSLSEKTAADVAAPYVGTYRYIDKFSKDSIQQFHISYENGMLRARSVPEDPYMKRFTLIRVGADIFTAGLYDERGDLYEVMRPDMMFTFKRTGGRVTGFEVRYDDDTLAATATRTP